MVCCISRSSDGTLYEQIWPSSSPESPVGPVWKPDLYRLQQEAPNPRAVCYRGLVVGCPPHYGTEFHGVMDHSQAARLLHQDGDYLVRMSSPQVNPTCCLSILFRGKVKHYKLYYEDGQHYVRDKRFDELNDLVADGLVTLHIEAEAGSYVQLMCDLAKYEKSPAYVTLNRLKKRQQREQRACSSGNTVTSDDRRTDQGGNGAEETSRLLDESPTTATSIIAYDKPHNFKTHNFKGLNWCEFCSNFLWGFTAQGVKCEDCGFSAHFKCSEKLPADCWPELKQVRSVFGVDLTTLVRAHRTTRPFVVDKCIDEIELRGLEAEGLYRVSGFADEMDTMRMALDRDGNNADISVMVYDNINVVAGILKLYFRLLPIPLLTYEVHPVLIKAVHLPSLNEQLQGTKDALALLPPAHYNTLKFLMAHLHRVVEHRASNKMSAQNLGTVFAPTLMPVETMAKGGGGRVGGSGGSIPDMTAEINVLCLLIQHHHEIFQPSDIVNLLLLRIGFLLYFIHSLKLSSLHSNFNIRERYLTMGGLTRTFLSGLLTLHCVPERCPDGGIPEKLCLPVCPECKVHIDGKLSDIYYN